MRLGISLRGYGCTPRYRLWWVCAVVTACLLLLPLLVQGQSTVQWKTNYYTVTGETLPEIRRSLARARSWMGSSEREGRTDWRIRHKFSVSSSGGVCRCRSFSTHTSITLTLPRWTPSATTAQPVIEEWERYLAALTAHEMGHAQFALATTRELHQRIKTIGEDSSCANLRARINALINSTTEEYKAKEKDFDRRTNHGIEQGVVLSGGRRRPPPDRE